MNTDIIISIITVIVVIGGAVGSILYHKNKAQKDQDQRELLIPGLTAEEDEIKRVVYYFVGKDYPTLALAPPSVYPVRNVKQHIPMLHMSWVNFRSGDSKPKNVRRGYGGMWYASEMMIFINCDNWKNPHFTKVLIHELLHALGWQHGNEMDAHVEHYLQMVKKEVSFL